MVKDVKNEINSEIIIAKNKHLNNNSEFFVSFS